MADYWVSTKRWTCPYCDITINDDIPSRRQHEGGFRHKNNVERSLKDLYRKSETQKRDAEKAKREMAQIEKLAEAAHQADLAAGAGASGITASASSSSQAGPSSLRSPSNNNASTSSRPKPPPPTSNKYLEAYGSTIAEEARRLEAEATAAAQKVAEEEALARKDGVPGEWETVATPTVAAATSSSELPSSAVYPPPSDRSAARNFRLQEKTAASAGDDEDDEGSLSTIKVKKRTKVEPNSAERQRLQEEEARRLLPVWNSMRLARPGESSSLKKEEVKEEVKQEADVPVAAAPESSEETSTAPSQARSPAIKTEDSDKAESKPPVDTTAGSNDQQASISISPPPIPSSSGGSGFMFKKRKAGAGAGAKKVRMF